MQWVHAEWIVLSMRSGCHGTQSLVMCGRCSPFPPSKSLFSRQVLGLGMGNGVLRSLIAVG
jgi:hypothetical protein